MAWKKKLQTIAETLRGMGFRAEHSEMAQGRAGLRSATNGITFDMIAGNETDMGVLRDLTFFTSFDLPEPVREFAEERNREKRFARLFHRNNNLKMGMDPVLPTDGDRSIVGDGADNWNRLVQDMVATLRARLTTESQKSV